MQNCQIDVKRIYIYLILNYIKKNDVNNYHETKTII